MEIEPLILEISSDEEEDWFSDLLLRVNSETNSEADNCDDVVVVHENFGQVASALKKRKTTPLHVSKGMNADSDDDCLILEGDPDKLGTTADDRGNGADDLLIVGERGQVACRDYPHSRHLCAKFPFATTPHEKHCKLCHCYVCDSLAPCIYWNTGASLMDHCHSTDKENVWRLQRQSFKQGKIAAAPSKGVTNTSLSVMLLPSVSGPASLPRSLTMGLSNSSRSSQTGLIQVPAYTSGFCTPNIIGHRQLQHSRLCRGRSSTVHTNGLQKQSHGLQKQSHGHHFVNMGRGGANNAAIPRVDSHARYLRPSYAGASSRSQTQANQHRRPVLNSHQPSPSMQPSYQSQQVLQNEDIGSWKDILAKVTSTEFGTYHGNLFSLGQNNFSHFQGELQLQPQLCDQSLYQLSANQLPNQSWNPTASAPGSDPMEEIPWFDAPAQDIFEQALPPEPPLLSGMQPPASTAGLLQNDPTVASLDDWNFGDDSMLGMSNDHLLSDLNFHSPEPTAVDNAMIFYELDMAANRA